MASSSQGVDSIWERRAMAASREAKRLWGQYEDVQVLREAADAKQEELQAQAQQD